MSKRVKTEYPGVYYREARLPKGHPSAAEIDCERVFYAVFKYDGKMVEVRAGGEITDGMTPEQASEFRGQEIERRKTETATPQAHPGEEKNLQELWDTYRVDKASIKSIVTDEKRFDSLLGTALGAVLPSQLTQSKLTILCDTLLEEHKLTAVKAALILLRRIVNHGTRCNMCPPLAFEIALPDKRQSAMAKRRRERQRMQERRGETPKPGASLAAFTKPVFQPLPTPESETPVPGAVESGPTPITPPLPPVSSPEEDPFPAQEMIQEATEVVVAQSVSQEASPDRQAEDEGTLFDEKSSAFASPSSAEVFSELTSASPYQAPSSDDVFTELQRPAPENSQDQPSTDAGPIIMLQGIQFQEVPYYERKVKPKLERLGRAARATGRFTAGAAKTTFRTLFWPIVGKCKHCNTRLTKMKGSRGLYLCQNCGRLFDLR